MMNSFLVNGEVPKIGISYEDIDIHFNRKPIYGIVTEQEIGIPDNNQNICLGLINLLLAFPFRVKYFIRKVILIICSAYILTNGKIMAFTTWLNEGMIPHYLLLFEISELVDSTRSTADNNNNVDVSLSIVISNILESA